jgi:uncharacterized membrane protein YobD (UPF0266 family)
MKMRKKQHEGISKFWGIAVVILTSIIVAVFTCLYVYFYKPPIYTILALAGILAGVGGGIILGFEICRQSRRIEKMDKGKKLLVIEQRSIDTLPKDFRYALAIVYFLLVICIIVDAIISNAHQVILFISLLVVYSVIFITPRRYEIYERGVRYGMIFVKWEDIKEVKWEDGILRIKADKIVVPIKIKDENGKIRKKIEESLSSSRT